MLLFPRKGFMRASNIALWRWVGYVIGAPDCVESPQKARSMMELVIVEAMQPTDTWRILIYNLIKALDGVPSVYASKSY